MQKDSEVLDSCIQQLYAEQEPSRILGIFKELASTLHSINARDNMKLTVIHHFCIVSDRLESRPDIIKDILAVLLKPTKETQGGLQFFSTFLSETEDHKKPEAEAGAKLMAIDSWGETAFHYLAKRGRCKVIEIILRSLADLGESGRLNVNATNGQGQTFTHILLMKDKYEFVQRLLIDFMGTYYFDCDVQDKNGQSIKSLLTRGLLNFLEKAVEKNDVELASRLLESHKKLLDLIPAQVIISYDELKLSLLHHVAKKGSFEMFKVFLSFIQFLVAQKADSGLLHEKDLSVGCDFLHFACKECTFDIISEILPLYVPDTIYSQSRNGNTCLHSLALNRQVALEGKVEIVKALVGICPKLCNVQNHEGHKPLTLWMLALSKIKEKDMVEMLIQTIAEKTGMEEWKDPEVIAKRNKEQLEILKERKERSAFFKGPNVIKRKKLKNKDKRIKERNEYRAKMSQLKACYGTVSPVEVAVRCQRKDWLEGALNKWGLSGDIVSMEGRHVLNYALEFCELELVQLLLNKGKVSRFIQGTSFDMDGAFIQAFYQAYKDLYYQRNNSMVSKEDTGILLEYQESAQKTTSKWYRYSDKDYIYYLVGKVAAERSVINDSEAKKRLEILNKALDIYTKAVRTPTGNPAPSEVAKGLIKYDATYIPLMGQKTLLSIASGIPECSSLVPLILNEIKGDSADLRELLENALMKGNIPLLETLEKHFKKTSVCFGKLDAYIRLLFIQFIRNTLWRIISVLPRYTDEPSKILAYMQEKIDLSKLLDECELSFKNGAWYDENWWYDRAHCKLNKVRAEIWIYDYFLRQFSTITEGLIRCSTLPLFVQRLLKTEVPSSLKMDSDSFESIKRALLLMPHVLRRLIGAGHYALAKDLLEYTHKLAGECLSATVRLSGSKLSVESEDFLFYFMNFRKFLKGSVIEDASSPIFKAMPKEDINGIRAYSKLCGSLYELLRENILSLQGHYSHYMSAYLNDHLKFLYGLRLSFKEEKSNVHSEFTNTCLLTLGKTFSTDKALPLIESIMSQKALFPYLAYHCFAHKCKNRRSPLKPVLNFAISNGALKVLKAILQKCPLIKPSLLYKITAGYFVQDPNVVFDLWETFLDRMATIVKDEKKKVAVSVLYELRQASAMGKAVPDEKHLRETLKLDPKEYKNGLVYVLIDNKYGYVISHLCRYGAFERTRDLLTKYELPLNLLSVELSHPYQHRKYVKNLQFLVREDLRGEDWLYYINKEKVEETAMKTREEEKKKMVNKGSKKGTLKRKKQPQKRKPKTKQLEIRKLPTVRYIRDSNYRVTCPFVELLRIPGDTKLKSEFIDVEAQVLSLKDSHKKLIVHNLLYTLSKHKKMTAKVFTDLWRYKSEINLIHSLRPTEQAPIHGFIATQGVELMAEVLLYAQEKDMNKFYLEYVTNNWVKLACKEFNADLLMSVYALKLQFGIKGSNAIIFGVPENHQQSALQKLFNLNIYDFSRNLYMNEKFKTMWKEYFRIAEKVPPPLGLKLNEMQKVLPLLGIFEPQLWIQLMSYFKNRADSAEATHENIFEAVANTLDQFADELMKSASRRTPSNVMNRNKQLPVKKIRVSNATSTLTRDRRGELVSASAIPWTKPLECMVTKHKTASVNANESLTQIMKLLQGTLKECVGNVKSGKDIEKLVSAVICINSPSMNEIEEICLKLLTEGNFESSPVANLLREYCSPYMGNSINTLILLKGLVSQVKFKDYFEGFDVTNFRNLASNSRHTLFKMLAEKSIADADTLPIFFFLKCAIVSGFKDIVELLLPSYITLMHETITNKHPYYETDWENTLTLNPVIAAILKSTKDLSIATLLANKLPKPQGFTFRNTQTQGITGLARYGEAVGFMEAAIYYDRPLVVEELLRIPEYHEYAVKKAEALIKHSFEAGNFNLGKRFLELSGTPLTPVHLQLALQYCDHNSCKELLYSLLSRYSSTDILDYKDGKGNTVLHLVAEYERKEFLFDLAEAGVFDFRKSEPHRSRLLAKNMDKCCPFVLAVQANHLDISNALFIMPDSLDELSDEEFNIITAPMAPTKALSQFRDERSFPIEAKLWSTLIPNKSTVIKVLDKIAELAFFEKKESHYKIKLPETGRKSSEIALNFVAELIKESKIGKIVPLLIFRKDLFCISKLLPAAFKVKKTLFEAIVSNRAMLPLAYVFSQIGLAPDNKEEIEGLLSNTKIFNDDSMLLILQVLNVIKHSTERSSTLLENVEPEHLFVSPYDFFVGKKPFKIGTKTEFSVEELSCLVPVKAKESVPAQGYDLDLVDLANKFFKAGLFKAFLTTLLYANQFDSVVFENICAGIDTVQLIATVFQEYPNEVPILQHIMPRKFEMVYDPARGVFLSAEDKSNELVFTSGKNTMASLLHYAFLYAGKPSLTLEGASPAETIKAILEYVVYEMIKLYGTNRVPVKPETTVELNTTKRSLIIWLEVLQRAFELMKVKSKLAPIVKPLPAKMAITEAELGELIAKVLDPTGIIFHTANGFMTLSVNYQEVLESAKSLPGSLGKPLLETISLLFTDKYLFGISEPKDSTEKYVIHVNVKLLKDSKADPASFAIKSMVEGKFPKKYVDTCFVWGRSKKLYKKPLNSFNIEVDYTINTHSEKFVKIPEVLPSVNSNLCTEITLGVMERQSPFEVKGKDYSAAISISHETVKKYVVALEEIFFADVPYKLQEMCKAEAEVLFEKIAGYAKGCSTLSTAPALIKEIADSTFSKPAKNALTRCLTRNPIDHFVIKLMTNKEWNAKKPPLEETLLESLRLCTTPGLETKECELVFTLPLDSAMQEPERLLVHETHAEFMGLRILASEAQLIRKINSSSRFTPPYIRIDTEGFIEKIAIPLSKQAAHTRNTRYANPLLVLEEFFNFSSFFPTIMKKLLTQLNEIKTRFSHDTTAVIVTFDKGKAISKLKLKGYPLVDQIIHFIDCEAKAVGNICEIKFLYNENYWSTEYLEEVLPAGDIGSVTNRAAPEDSMQTMTEYLETITNEVKLLESIFTETELFDKYLGREELNLDKLSQGMSNILGKTVSAAIDWQSLYTILKESMKDKGQFKNNSEYYAYKSEYYRLISQIGQCMTTTALEAKFKHLASNQVNEMFLTYFKSTARKTALKGEREIGNFSFLKNAVAGTDEFYNLKRLNQGCTEGIQEYPIYRPIALTTLKENVSTYKGTECMVQMETSIIGPCTLFDINDRLYVFKRRDKNAIIKYAHDKVKKIYLRAIPEAEPYNGNYFVADPNGRLWEISHENYNEMLKGDYITKLLPDKILIRFHNKAIKVPSIKDGTIEMPYEVSPEEGKLEALGLDLTKRLPLKLFYYGYSDFKKFITEFQANTTNFLRKYKLIPKKGGIVGHVPQVIFDFSPLEGLARGSYSQLAYCISTVLDSLYNAIAAIVCMQKLTQNAKLVNSLPINLSSYGEKLEFVQIAHKVTNLLLKYPVKISFVLTSAESKSNEVVYLDGVNLNMAVPLKCNLEVDGDLTSLLPWNMMELLHDRIVEKICNEEIKQLKFALEEINKGIDKIGPAETMIDEADPLKAQYYESIFWTNKVLNTIFPYAIQKQLLNVLVNEKDYSLAHLRVLLSLPSLIRNIGNAFRLAKGVNGCPEGSRVTIKVVEGSSIATKYWDIEKNANEEFIITILTHSASDYVIPKENDLVEALLKIAIKDVPAPLETLIIGLQCASIQVDEDKPAFMSPLVTNTGSYTKVFTLFKTEPYKPVDPEKEGLMPLITGCSVPLKSYLPASEVKVSQSMGKLSVTFYISKLDGPYKVLFRIGNRVLYSKIFLCYEEGKEPLELLEKDKNVAIYYADAAPGAVHKLKAKLKPMTKELYPIESPDRKYLVYISNDQWQPENKCSITKVAEDLVRIKLKWMTEKSEKLAVLCNDLTTEGFLPISNKLAKIDEAVSPPTAKSVMEAFGGGNEKDYEDLASFCALSK